MLKTNATTTQEDGDSIFNNYSFKILTWNVWFDILEFPDRMSYIIEQVLRIGPDVACFQEVVPSFAEMLRKHEKLKRQYTISPYEPVHNYGNITLVKHNATFRIVEFPNSKMGRKLTLATFKINGIHSMPDISVGNVHLESLNNRGKRAEQMCICRDHLPQEASILVGDFNISADDHVYRNRLQYSADTMTQTIVENDAVIACLPGFTDTWLLQVPTLHARFAGDSDSAATVPELNLTTKDSTSDPGDVTPSKLPSPPPTTQPPVRDYYGIIDELGYTFDTVKNNMNRSAASERKRIDRIMTSLNPDTFQFQDIRLLGTEPIALKEKANSTPRLIFPSDHYGLLCTYNVRYSTSAGAGNTFTANDCCTLS